MVLNIRWWTVVQWRSLTLRITSSKITGLCFTRWYKRQVPLLQRSFNRWLWMLIWLENQNYEQFNFQLAVKSGKLREILLILFISLSVIYVLVTIIIKFLWWNVWKKVSNIIITIVAHVRSLVPSYIGPRVVSVFSLSVAWDIVIIIFYHISANTLQFGLQPNKIASINQCSIRHSWFNHSDILFSRWFLFQWKHSEHYKIGQLGAISEFHWVVWCDQEFPTLLINSETVDTAWATPYDTYWSIKIRVELIRISRHRMIHYIYYTGMTVLIERESILITG